MTMIFYDRSFISLNEDFIEITNKEFLAKLKTDFYGSYSKYYSMTPLICGTINNKAIGQNQFDRKLKMLKAPLFALLQMLSSREFTTDGWHAKVVKESMTAFL